VPITLYHNPKCAKSREALQLLRQHGIEPQIIEYLKTPPSTSELAALVRALGVHPRDLLRMKEPEYRAAGLGDPKLSDKQILSAMVKYPRLIERPILVKGKHAVLGRPPENVLKLL
jgi:arsenate reductase